MELWDLYDKDGNKTGEVWERKPMNYLNIPEGRYHIVGDILVKHVDGTFLLTKRDPRQVRAARRSRAKNLMHAR